MTHAARKRLTRASELPRKAKDEVRKSTELEPQASRQNEVPYLRRSWTFACSVKCFHCRNARCTTAKAVSQGVGQCGRNLRGCPV